MLWLQWIWLAALDIPDSPKAVVVAGQQSFSTASAGQKGVFVASVFGPQAEELEEAALFHRN